MRVLPVRAGELEWLALPWREPWRLITPVLVHFDMLHILFNMLWLRDLGSRNGAGATARATSALFVLVCGVISNIAQYEITQQPDVRRHVRRGLRPCSGSIWVRGQLDARVGYGLSRFTVQFMLIWLVVGFCRQPGHRQLVPPVRPVGRPGLGLRSAPSSPADIHAALRLPLGALIVLRLDAAGPAGRRA
ncbi:MAG: rhomboid family intramembrane serine protease [Pseudoxanthomonas sp.]